MCLVFFIHPIKTIVIHMVIEIGIVTVKCDVSENVCGYKAIKFIARIEIKIKVSHDFSLFFVLFREKEISFSKILIILYLSVFLGLLIFHRDLFIKRGIKASIIHDVDKYEDVGSKIENKLFIILLSFYWFLRVFIWGILWVLGEIKIFLLIQLLKLLIQLLFNLLVWFVGLRFL